MPDPSVSPTSNMDISDTTSDTNQPTTGADAVTPPTEQGPQTQQPIQPQQAAPAPVPPSAPQQSPSAAGTVTNDPAVAHAGRFYKFATALAGGPRYTESVDANTGKMTRTAVPLSKGDIGMAIAMEAISGALSGLAQTGPGNLGRAAAAGAQTVTQQQQTQQQQQDQQASGDFARHMQVLETNLRLHQNAQTIGRQNLDTNENYVAQFKPLADQLQIDHPEVVKGLVAESDLSKFHVTKDSAIPVNVVKRLDPATGKQAENLYGEPQWDVQYLVVDPHFKSDDFLSADDRAEAAKFRLPGFADSDGKPSNLPQSLPMKLNMALGYKSRIASLKLADSDVSNFYGTLNANLPKGTPQYTPVNLIDAVKSDPTLPSALEKFQPLLNATQQNYARAIGELGKVNPQAAGKILALYGGTKAVNQFDQQQTLKAEAAKRQIDNQAAIEEQRALIPIKAATAGAEERSRLAAKPTSASLDTPDALGFTPTVTDVKEANKRFGTFKKNLDDLSRSEQSYAQFQQAIANINAGKWTGADSVVALFNAIGLSAAPLAGRGFRINQNTIAEHEHARGWEGALQAKLQGVQSGAVITPQQLRDYAGIASQSRANQVIVTANQMHAAGIPADAALPQGNGATITPDTAKIFLTLANGDPQKARQAAQAKGWSF